VGFGASPPLAALGVAFCSSAISVDAYGKAPLYGQQKHEFLHIADKHVNREEGDTRARDVEVEVRAFFLICCTLLNLLVRKGKGPEGRSRLAG
jgi:hypothetical protein